MIKVDLSGAAGFFDPAGPDYAAAAQAHRTLLHVKLHQLYRLLQAEPAHAFLVFGDGHSIPDLSSDCVLSWMDRWLKHDGNALGAWDARLTPCA